MYIMPTIRELKAKIKKYKDTHCAGISRMKKANLIRMADKIGLNPPSDDVKTLRSVIKAHQTKNCAAYSKLSKPKLIQMCKKLGLLDSEYDEYDESKERESKKLESKRSSRDPFVSTETEDERAVRRRVLGPILEDESSEIMRRTARINRGYDEPIKLKLKKKKKQVQSIRTLKAPGRQFTSDISLSQADKRLFRKQLESFEASEKKAVQTILRGLSPDQRVLFKQKLGRVKKRDNRKFCVS